MSRVDLHAGAPRPTLRQLVWSRLGFTPEGGLEPPWSDLYAARRTTAGFAEPEKVASVGLS